MKIPSRAGTTPGRSNQGQMFVGCRVFKMMVSLSQMQFTVAPVSALMVIILVEFLSNACLYELNLGVTEVLSVEFNKIFLLIFVAILGNVPHRNYVNP